MMRKDREYKDLSHRTPGDGMADALKGRERGTGRRAAPAERGMENGS